MRFGSLFSGYGGLDLGVQSVLGGTTAWFCEFDKAPSKILAHHWPDVPNLGDITAVDWATVEPVDVLTGGFPCQDVSHAGRRAGLIRDGEGRTRSGLWGHMLRAVDELRPRLVVAENVRGLLSAQADSDVEPCAWCMGDDGASPMRALGAVLADLADVGYDAAWYGLRAADVGAAHGRFRVFIYAWPAGSEGDPWWFGDGGGLRTDGPRGAAAGDGLTLLPTPRATDGTKGGPNQRGSSGDLMLPSAVNLLPTPLVGDATGGRTKTFGKEDGTLQGIANLDIWGDYAPAIARWEHATGRPAPVPTEPGKNGNPRLSPKFVEWLMGLPAGHVTDPAIGLTRNEALKCLGNGVVPTQAAAATRAFIHDITQERAA